MKILTENKVIPAIEEKIIKVEIYEAEDGTKFEGYDAENKCKRYELECEVKNSINGIPHRQTELLEGYEVANSFYIKTLEEFHAVLNYMALIKYWHVSATKKTTGFKGEDWYSFWTVEYDNRGNEYNLTTLTEEKEVIQDFLNQFTQ